MLVFQEPERLYASVKQMKFKFKKYRATFNCI